MIRLYPESASVTVPVALGLRLGGMEIYGGLSETGDFQERDPLISPVREVLPLAVTTGLVVPCQAEIIDDAGKPIATINIGVHNGRVAVKSIEALDGHEITGHVLRQVPLVRLVRAASAPNIVHLRDGFAVHFVGNMDADDLHQPRRRSLNDAFLMTVADIYRDALAEGVPPSLAVMKRLGPTTPENARRWVGIARRRGFLGPAPNGRAGEISPRSRQAGRRAKASTPRSHPSELLSAGRSK